LHVLCKNSPVNCTEFSQHILQYQVVESVVQKSSLTASTPMLLQHIGTLKSLPQAAATHNFTLLQQ
jgi:hypothetical protein